MALRFKALAGGLEWEVQKIVFDDDFSGRIAGYRADGLGALEPDPTQIHNTIEIRFGRSDPLESILIAERYEGEDGWRRLPLTSSETCVC